MIVRIVRMTFHEKELESFHRLFEDAAPNIRAFPGCRHLELWSDVDAPDVRTTYSVWESPGALDAYRSSELFRSTWAETRKLFSEPAEASSYVRSHGPFNVGLSDSTSE